MSCGQDCLVNIFDFEGKTSMTEEDCVESVYCSEQPLLSCGFIGKTDYFYAITSINTVELCQVSTGTLATKIQKYQHWVDYLIGAQAVGDQFYLYCGNNLGEIYVYEVDIYGKYVVNEETGEIKKDNLKLVNMVLTENSHLGQKEMEHIARQDPLVVRNCFQSKEGLLICTNELNKIQIYNRSSQ